MFNREESLRERREEMYYDYLKQFQEIEDKEEKCNKKNHSKLKRNGAIISNKKWKIGNGKVEQGNLNYKLIGEPIDLYSNEYFQNLY